MSPLIYLPDLERHIIFATKAGAPGFGDYEQSTAGVRTIPVSALPPAA
ncbi:hypothetical protein [Pseudonocardia sp. H11422]|nr:hypothetical protein [Pseudonocardia sp. H11422]